MDMTKYEAFLSAAESGSFTAAGRILGYTQSGITRMIDSLEKECGFPLFIRKKKGVELTENGRLLLPQVRSAVRADKSVQELTAQIKGVMRGTITLGCYFSVSAILMPDILKTFENKYPNIQVRIREGGNLEIAKWLDEGSVDLAVCALPKTVNEICWIPLFKDRMVVWLPASHPKAKAAAFPIKDMEKEPFIHTSPGRDTDQDRLIRDEHLHMDERYSTMDGFTTYNMVEAGLGISFNQRMISRKWHGSVCEVPLTPARYVEIGIALPLMAEASPATHIFMRHIQESEEFPHAGGQ